jgi:predicted exporter
MRRDVRLAGIIVVLILGAAAYVGFQFHQRNPIDTDILSLLPGDRKTPVLADALARLNDVAANRIALMIEGGDAATRGAAASDLTQRLSDLGFFRPIAADGRALWDWVFAQRTVLACPQDKVLLRDGRGDIIARDALTQWYMPFGVANSALLKSDPLLLAPRLMKCLLARVGALQSPSAQATVVSGSITESVFRADVQDQIAKAIAAWQDHWSASGLSIKRAGAVFHAAHAAASARWQMSIISVVTVALILVIYRLIFGSIRPAFIALILISSCLIVGLAVTLGLFTQIHVMVMVFAAALIGMVVDYSTYYLITGVAAPEAPAADRRSSIFRPLTLGMLTSVGAFAALLGASISAFRQIAILGGVGLLFAWLTALYLLPMLEGRIRPCSRSADRMQAWANRLLARPPTGRSIAIAIAATLALAAAAWAKGGALDDIRQFQTPSKTLAAEEADIRSVTGFSSSGALFLVTGGSAEEAKRNEEALIEAVNATGGRIISIAASSLDPSTVTREAQRKLIAENLLNVQLPDLLRSLKITNNDPYQMAAEAPLPDLVALLRGQTGATFWSIVPVSIAAADVPAALRQGSTWIFVDSAAAYSGLMTEYRWIASFGLAGGAIAIGVILLVVYRRATALWIMLPTVLAMVATPSILALLGLPYSFFSAMGLFLVIGAGVDYGIFQWEHATANGNWTRLGIALAALMTCISLGLLGFSSILPVASFGANVALGIFLSLILSPIAIFGRRAAMPNVPAGLK